MFFAYRDFVGDADHLLENFGLGRAHHRLLHFVNRRPGLTIAELLDILKITKQSLNRVLKDLLDRNYIVARPGENDRRQRLLFPTGRGEALALDVARVQSKRFARVFAQLPEAPAPRRANFFSPWSMRASGARWRPSSRLLKARRRVAAGQSIAR